MISVGRRDRAAQSLLLLPPPLSLLLPHELLLPLSLLPQLLLSPLSPLSVLSLSLLPQPQNVDLPCSPSSLEVWELCDQEKYVLPGAAKLSPKRPPMIIPMYSNR